MSPMCSRTCQLTVRTSLKYSVSSLTLGWNGLSGFDFGGTIEVQFMFYLTTWESLIGHSRWALPHYTEMGHSSSSFWGTASPDRGSNPRSPVPMALNIPEGHRGIGPSVSNWQPKRWADIVDSHTAFRKKRNRNRKKPKTLKMADTKNKC